MLVQGCKNSFIKSLFQNQGELEQSAGKLNFISVGSKFRSQLAELMNKLRSTVSFYVMITGKVYLKIMNEFRFYLMTRLTLLGDGFDYSSSSGSYTNVCVSVILLFILYVATFK